MLVLLTIAILVAGWIGIGAYGYLQFFRVVSQFRERRFMTRQLWRGEIVFAEKSVSFAVGPTGPSEVRTINPTTGIVRSTGISGPGYLLGAIVDGDRLWVISSGEISETDGTTVKRHTPKMSLPLTSAVFFVDHRLCAISTDTFGKRRLYTWVDGEWQPGPQVAMPGYGRTWTYDIEQNRHLLLPRTSRNGAAQMGSWEISRIVQIGTVLHVISTSYGAKGFDAVYYRSGLDLISEELPSALAPENAEPDTTGWERLDEQSFDWQAAPFDWQGNLAVSSARGIWLRDSSTGKFKRHPMSFWDSGELVHTGDDFYAIRQKTFGETLFFLWKDNRWQPLPISLPVNGHLMAALFKHLVALVVIAWALAQLVLLAGAQQLSKRWPDRFSFGHTAVTLAPLGRRWLARGIDLAVAGTPLVTVVTLACVWATVQDLVDFERMVRSFPFDLRWNSGNALNDAFTRWSTFVVWSSATGIWAIAVLIGSAVVQGRTGITFGKWICGLRVVRTTLRPCGRLRSLLRELLFVVETGCLFCPIPAIAMILNSETRQRLGDRMADTLVIVSPSLTKDPP